MINKNQIAELAKLYKIDSFTIMREYLQLVLLSHLYQQKESRAIYFKGGTAIRFLFGSPRFSEDLDFSTKYDRKEINEIITKVEQSVRKEIIELRIVPVYSGEEGERFRVTYKSKDFKYPLVIRLDFHLVGRIGRTEVSAIVTKFPLLIFPLVSHLTEQEILAEKIKALADRGKGRDFFDIWYLLKKGNSLPKNIEKEEILRRIKQVETSRLNRDLAQFLPLAHRGVIKTMKKELAEFMGNITI